MKVNRNREIEFTEDFAIHSKGDKVTRGRSLAADLVLKGVAKYADKNEVKEVVETKPAPKPKAKAKTKK